MLQNIGRSVLVCGVGRAANKQTNKQELSVRHYG